MVSKQGIVLLHLTPCGSLFFMGATSCLLYRTRFLYCPSLARLSSCAAVWCGRSDLWFGARYLGRTDKSWIKGQQQLAGVKIYKKESYLDTTGKATLGAIRLGPYLLHTRQPVRFFLLLFIFSPFFLLPRFHFFSDLSAAANLFVSQLS